MTTVSTVPTLVASGKKSRVKFTLTESNTNYVRVWCTAAPEGSGLGNKILALGKIASAPRVQVFEGQGGADHPWANTFDKGGVYTLKAQEYTKGNAWGGGYLNDPRGAPTETKVGSEATLSLLVGDRLTHQLGTGPDQATLVVYAWNDTIRRTSKATHGEDSPAIVNPTSERARAAAGKAAVLTQLGFLVDDTLTSLLGASSLLGVVADLQSKFDTHLTFASRHDTNDTNNTIGTELSTTVSPDGFPAALALIARKIRQHLTNDSGSGAGSAAYHKVSGNEKADWLNVPIMMSCTPETATALLSDLVRSVYEHVGGPGAPTVAIHGNNTTTTQVPATIGSLVELHRAFFTALALNAPTAVAGQGSLAAALASYGFKTG